ncbi:MAG: RsmE family RNA methyltransferase, partial [Pyrinomonadaceae bacterium]
MNLKPETSNPKPKTPDRPMTRRRFYAPPSAFTSDGARVALSPEESQHLRGVLRLGPGDEAYVFDGEGREFRCGVESDGQERKRKGGAEAQLVVIESVVPQSPESPLALTLAVGLLKGEKFDLVMQKATELGVVRVVPVSTKRADVRLRDERDAEVRRARWQRLALEAAKQSGRAVVPQVSPPVTFESLLADVAAGVTFGDRLLFTERQGRGLRERAGGGANETRPTAL